MEMQQVVSNAFKDAQYKHERVDSNLHSLSYDYTDASLDPFVLGRLFMARLIRG